MSSVDTNITQDPSLASTGLEARKLGGQALAGEGHDPSHTQDRFLQLFNRVMIAVVGLIVLGVAAANAHIDPGATLNAFSTRFLSVFIEAAPFLLLGTLLSGLIDAFVAPGHIARWVPRNPFFGVLAGTFAGFVFPVCECGVVPVVRQLYSKSLPLPVGISFLLAAPVMNPIVVASTVTAFGWGPVLAGRYA